MQLILKLTSADFSSRYFDIFCLIYRYSDIFVSFMDIKTIDLRCLIFFIFLTNILTFETPISPLPPIYAFLSLMWYIQAFLIKAGFRARWIVLSPTLFFTHHLVLPPPLLLGGNIYLKSAKLWDLGNLQNCWGAKMYVFCKSCKPCLKINSILKKCRSIIMSMKFYQLQLTKFYFDVCHKNVISSLRQLEQSQSKKMYTNWLGKSKVLKYLVLVVEVLIITKII